LSVSFRPQVRAAAKMKILLNKKMIKTYSLTGAEKWHDDILYLSPKEGSNVIEFMNEPIKGEAPPVGSHFMLFRALSLKDSQSKGPHL
jgi:hypothetical protein